MSDRTLESSVLIVLAAGPMTRAELISALLPHEKRSGKGRSAVDPVLAKFRRRRMIERKGTRGGRHLWHLIATEPRAAPVPTTPPCISRDSGAQTSRMAAYKKYTAVKDRFEASIQNQNMDSERLARDLAVAAIALAETADVAS